jgi:hypothetical protein
LGAFPLDPCDLRFQILQAAGGGKILRWFSLKAMGIPSRNPCRQQDEDSTPPQEKSTEKWGSHVEKVR